MALNQSISYLQRRLDEVGIRPDSRKGQNFLIDHNLQKLLVRAGDVGPNDVVLEIGTGTGGLTELIAEQAAAVVTVEVDQQLYDLASDVLYDRNNITMLQFDALKNKNRFDPRLIEVIEEQLAEAPGRVFKLVANLPYSIATPVISNLLSCPAVPAAMTATIQKELADRIVASPSTKDYGSLSVWVQSQCEVEIVRVLAPSVFWPRPKVTSAVVQITLDTARREAIPNLHYFHQFVRAIFIHRRKFLRSNLVGALKRHLGKPEIDEIMGKLDLGPNARAEQLDVPTMLALTEAVREQAPDWTL